MIETPYQPPASRKKARAFGWHVLAPMSSCLGTAVLIAAAKAVRSDRTQSRQPIVTYVGPMSSWMPGLVYAGLGLSLLGFLVGLVIVNRNRNSSTFTPALLSAAIAMAVAAVNALGSFIVYCGTWED